ncbi:glycosyltransferase family 4 protein [Bosea lathyri]|nr:glycosyltransferase family 4 protein [Bosea lathyri]
MRVSLVSMHYAEYTGRLAMALASRHTVELHLSTFNARNEVSEEFLRRLAATGVQVHLHPRPLRKNAVLDGWRLGRAIARFAPDVIHAQEAAAWTVLASLMLGPRRRRLVLTVHDPKPHQGADMAARARAEWAVRRVRTMADDIIVHGDSLLQDMADACPSFSGRLHSVQHGALGEVPGESPKAPLNSILFFGRIQAYKGLGVLLDAVDIMTARGLSFELRIAGTGPDLDRYRDRLARLPNVHLDERYIPAEEIAPAFMAAAIVVMPYTEATQSGVAAYALAAGKPVVVTRVGAITEVVRDGFNGLVVEPNDPIGLADALTRLVQEPDLAAELADGAYHTAETMLSWSVIGKKTSVIYGLAS